MCRCSHRSAIRGCKRPLLENIAFFAGGEMVWRLLLFAAAWAGLNYHRL